MFVTRAFALLASIALAAAVCETSNNSPNTGDCYAAADALGALNQNCCQTTTSCTQMMVRGNCRVAVCAEGNVKGGCIPCSRMAQYTRDLINACKNDGIGKVGGKSNSFQDGWTYYDNLHIELWRT